MGLFRNHAQAPDVCDRCGHIAGMHVNTAVGCRLCQCPRSPGQVVRHIDTDDASEARRGRRRHRH